MRKITIFTLTVSLVVVGYVLSRPKEDAPVSAGGEVSEAKQPEVEVVSQSIQVPLSFKKTAAEQLPTLTNATESDEEEETSQHSQAAEVPGDVSEQLTFEALGDQEKEEHLSELLSAEGSDVEKYVDVQSIACRQGVCTVDAIAKDGASRFQMAMAYLLPDNPWLGNKMMIETAGPDQPGIATFTFYKE